MPPLELLGKRSAILTLERCKSTIAKKGAFIASFREVNLGDGGGDLTVEQYEALILEHFLVYCAASKIDRSILTDFDGLETADTRAVEDAREEKTMHATSLVIEVESEDMPEVVPGLGTPILDIVQKQGDDTTKEPEGFVISETAPPEHGSGVEDKEKKIGASTELTAESEVASESTAQLLAVTTLTVEAETAGVREDALSVDSRIEANYLGEGTWYKGIVTAVHEGEDGETYTYDIEYDDDETEQNVAANNVRKVEKLSIRTRTLSERREFEKEKENIVSPNPVGSPESLDPFLELSQSHE